MKTNKSKISDKKLELGPGEFYITDPCYLYPKEKWHDFCNLLFKTSGDERLFESYQIPFFVFGTAYGDGQYPVLYKDKVIGSCGVDAGMLSIIPIELIKKWKATKEAARLIEKKLIVKIKLESNYTVYQEGGVCHFGDFTIDTVCANEDEYDDYDMDEANSLEEREY